MRYFVSVLFILGILQTYAQTSPVAHRLSVSPYYLSSWSPNSTPGTYPPSMTFQQFVSGEDPDMQSEPIGDWLCAYNIDSRSRFVGLGSSCIGMINSGNEQDDTVRCGNGKALGGRVGAVVLAINTLEMTDIELSWKIRMIESGNGYPEPRVYKIMVQYRVGNNGEWSDFPASAVYSSIGKNNGDVQEFTVVLPESLENQEYVQLRWKYYQESSNDGGTRPFLALDDVKVLGANIRTGYRPFLFFSETSLDVFGCILDDFSEPDSIVFSGIALKEDLIITAPKDFYISLSKEAEFETELVVPTVNGYIPETKLYIKKKCTQLETEYLNLIFQAGTYNRTFPLRGEGYYNMYINEIVSSNFISYFDPVSSDYPDWIEIYNPNEEEVILEGYYLSDNKNYLNKHRIITQSESKVAGKGFKLFFASGVTTRRFSHLNFSLSSAGESIYLVGKNGKTIIDSLTFGQIDTDVSYGRVTDGGEAWTIFPKSTPGATNTLSVGVSGKASSPVFSHKGGYYDSTFVLSLQANNPDAKIYYTLDGSDPTPDNVGGFVYEYKQNYSREVGLIFHGDSYYRPYRSYFYFEPIDLMVYRSKYFWLTDVNSTVSLMPYSPRYKREHAVIVRAVAIEQGKSPSNIVSNTYFFTNDDTIKDKLPVISIVLNEDKLVGFDDGIGVPGIDYENWRNNDFIANTTKESPANYRRSGRMSEIPANIEVFDNKKQIINQSVGLRNHGASSRAFRHRSFRLYARNYYGKDRITYPFFKNLAYEDFSRFILRNSGVDYEKTFFKDAFIQQIMAFSNMDYQEYNPYVIYVNGEYWGMLNARERIDKYYLGRKYGLDEDNIDFLQNNRIVIEGTSANYTLLLNFLSENDMSSDEAYNEVNKRIDVENYIDFQSLKIYTAEYDWPNNNVRYWRYKTDQYDPKAPYGLDGRWRWVNFDNDYGFRLDRLNLNTFEWALSFYDPRFDPEGQEEWWATFLFRTLMKNDDFKLKLITRFSDLLNTAFKSSRVLAKIDWHKNLIEHDMQNHVVRWDAPGSMQNWNANVDELKTFATERPALCYNHMRESFGLTDLYTVTIDVDDMARGHVKLNTMEFTKQTPGVDTTQVYPWQGQYFKDLPVSFIPIPHEGYKFSHWELTDSNSYIDTLVFDLKKDVKAKAFFIVDDNYVYNPEPAIITDCPYEFNEWARKQRVGDKPANMAFYYTKFPDSKANGPLEGRLDSIRYDYSTRTRINGLGANGISLINTADANENYYQTRLGAVAVAFKTENVPAAEVSFTLGTVTPQSKKYSIRLQYRLSDKGDAFDFYDKNGNLVEYHGDYEADHEQRFNKIELPGELLNQKYVQLIWRYYYNGQQVDAGSNTRDELRIDDIKIRQKDIVDVLSNEAYVSSLVGNPNSQSFQWYRCEGDSLVLLENETRQLLRITAPGTYAVAVNYGECTHTSACEYFFVKERKEFAPSIFSKIHPNPSNGIFDLVFDETLKDVRISMADATGKVVNVKNVSEAKAINYQVKNLAAGVYILDITTKDGRQATQKVMIQ